MAEQCRHAYRKRGDVSIHCRAIEGDGDWCAFQQMCHVQHRYVNTPSAGSCVMKNKPDVK